MHITATIDNGWHTFSQMQPKDAIALPTSISFNKNPLIQLKGKMKELGKMEKYKEKTLDIEQWQYCPAPSFRESRATQSRICEREISSRSGGSYGRMRPAVQRRFLNQRNEAPLPFDFEMTDSSISYQTCNDHECLPPKTERFSVLLE